MSRLHTFKTYLLTAALSLGAFGLSLAHAQTPAWPVKPVTLVVPFPPGGSVDQLARLLQPHLQASLGQPVIVDNKAGASGSVGAAAAAKAAPDGYTWLLVFDTHGVNPSLIPSLPYDTLKDLVPVMLVGTSPMLLVAHPSSPAKTFAAAMVEAKSKGISYGTIGSGSLAHLAMTQLSAQTGVSATHIPYKGGGPLTTDALAGHVPYSMASAALFAQHIAAGRLVPLAVTSPQRSPLFPEVPAMAESVPGFKAEAWWGMHAPARTPPELVTRMHTEMLKAMRQPNVQERFKVTGFYVSGLAGDEYQKFLASEIDRWAKVVRDHKIKAGE
jgi:tripartite-type tricarboxylate transporter receptor subunit TctC